MPRIYLALLLIASVTAISGCLEIEQRYILRPDGSLIVRNDIALDQSLLKMIAGMQKGDTSATALSMPEGEITQVLIDSLREVFGGKNIAHYRTLPQVLDASITDTVDLKGIHFRSMVTLRSYRDLYLVAQDTIPGAGSMLPRDSAIFVESGDSLIFQVEHEVDSALQSMLPAPEPPKATDSKATPSKTKRGKKGKHAVKPAPEPASTDDFSGALANLFHFDIVVESPLLLGADTSAKFDASHQSATWTIDATSAGQSMLKMRAWFKRP
jgi:hypothetical protein